RRRRSSQIFEERPIARIATGVDRTVLDRLLDGAIRLRQMGTRGEMATRLHGAKLRKEIAQILGSELPKPEIPHSWSVGEECAEIGLVQIDTRRRMAALPALLAHRAQS